MFKIYLEKQKHSKINKNIYVSEEGEMVKKKSFQILKYTTKEYNQVSHLWRKNKYSSMEEWESPHIDHIDPNSKENFRTCNKFVNMVKKNKDFFYYCDIIYSDINR